MRTRHALDTRCGGWLARRLWPLALLLAGAAWAPGLPAASAQEALPCAPRTTCFTVDESGRPDPEGSHIAQCTGRFPDYIVERSLMPPGYDGPWFALAQNYPSKLPEKDEHRWLKIDFWKDMDRANDYLYALRDYALDGNIRTDFRVRENWPRRWYAMPYLNFGEGRREFVRGMTEERPLTGPAIGLQRGLTVRNFSTAFYNAPGGQVLGQVWREPNVPDLAASRFPVGTMMFRLLFSTAKPGDFLERDVLAGAPSWQIAVADRNGNLEGGQLTEVRLIQMDVAARDERAGKTGWMFGSLAYDATAPDENPWKRLRPVGLTWGNDPGVAPGGPLEETVISDQIPAYAAGQLGWGGRLDGPVNNPASSLMSRQATAQYPVAAAMSPPASCTNQEKLHWFRNLSSEDAFGFVPRGACTPEEPPVELTGLDYSVQMMAAVNNLLGHRVANPCNPFVGLAAISQKKGANDDKDQAVPEIARGGLIYR